jgi:hypothetical protein
LNFDLKRESQSENSHQSDYRLVASEKRSVNEIKKLLPEISSTYFSNDLRKTEHPNFGRPRSIAAMEESNPSLISWQRRMVHH